ncbi:hypothetical protein ACWERY_24100 [Streptomyces sp. NPDC004082]|uniref:hypothetical protein n=1 Tax=unclassified Streptomyces TaxID=2593676 RepID=UPI0033BF6B0A
MHVVTEMKSPILEIRPLFPAVAQTKDRVCSMTTAGHCDALLVAEVFVQFADGTVHQWRVCGEWLTCHPKAIDHIKVQGFAEPRSEKPAAR